MTGNYFIYALENAEGARVPVVLEVQDLTTDCDSGEILGAFGIGYSIETPSGSCVAVPGHLLTQALDADFAETLIYHIRRHRRCFVPRRLCERMPWMAMHRTSRIDDSEHDNGHRNEAGR